MAEVRLSLPPATQALVDDKGVPPLAWRRFLEGVFTRLGGATDNVFAALAASLSGVTGEIVASGGLQFGGLISADTPVPISLYRTVGPVASLPTTGKTGDWSFANDARNAGEGAGLGTGSPVYWTSASINAWRIPGQSGAVTA